MRTKVSRCITLFIIISLTEITLFGMKFVTVNRPFHFIYAISAKMNQFCEVDMQKLIFEVEKGTINTGINFAHSHLNVT